jgi:hypothetical protein
MTASDPAALRRSYYLLLIAVSVGIAAAKIVGAENVYEPSRYRPPTETSFGADRDKEYIPERVWPKTRPEPTQTFSSNDKSRWATIRALVEDCTYVVGRRSNFEDKSGPWDDKGIIFLPDYQSLDKVMNPETGEFYSSKPPLFPTVVAGEYWLLRKLFGWSIDRDRWSVMAAILLTVNVLPLAVYLLLLSRLIDDYAESDFARLLAFTTACCGTFLTTFSHTLNNHVPAAYCALFAVYPLLSKRGTSAIESPSKLLASGFFAGLTATLDLPAAALAAGLFVPLLIVRPGKTLAFFLPGLLVPVAALLYCNYAAMGSVLPAYSEFGGPWYNYPGSHWARLGTPAAKGIDFADEPKTVYAFHLLFGHHGWFSLTPVWLLGAAGMAALAWKAGPQVKLVLLTRRPGQEGLWSLSVFGAMTLAVSVVVFLFYVWRSNNYGGFTSGPRWLFWLIPLWLLGTLPAADWVGRYRAGRLAAAVLLGFSVLSVFYPAWNPWRPPWILQLCELNGWVRY